MAENILFIEDTQRVLDARSEFLRDWGYEVIPCMYSGRISDLPAGKYEHAIIDGLEGAWKDVARALEGRCGDMIICSGETGILEDAAKAGYKVSNKREGIMALRELLSS